ncbi:nucleoside triphosphate pyrophosphohydrolase [Clostridium aminobutyricum]|uniref:Nucleoside triphosphate pyrophosphohydrolase n=1 Tax=Clostridium aminobutyricum TaxID=33953 RepID=A0A939IGY5_CLOAM|nr:nucleoside triphosphate pyrophosphohydrolase [Clostridium aminobutyricum]MBN7774160.1 nucleoside triphosphate pyrophosphohydrolase [Clostridium aminobutyricum]
MKDELKEQVLEEYADLYIKAGTSEEAIARLIKIIHILRRECPWDKVQTHKSLRKCMIEEAYEVVEAINNEDQDNLEEELGDVLLQVIFHSGLGAEQKHFDFVSVTNRECEKMLRRHPHVFFKETAKTIDNALEKWENVKRKEKGKANGKSRLTDVPKALPALTRSYKVQARAAEVGFDWDDVSCAFHKIKEETEELLEVYKTEDRDSIIAELGDLLFSVVNVARFLKVDPEEALNSTSEKFIRRFAHIENVAVAKGLLLENMTLSEMDKLWEEAKILERETGK